MDRVIGELRHMDDVLEIEMNSPYVMKSRIKFFGDLGQV